MITKKEGVISAYNEKNELVAIVVKDEVSRKNIVYNVTEAALEDIENYFRGNEKQ
jgi:hypothetical protein